MTFLLICLTLSSVKTVFSGTVLPVFWDYFVWEYFANRDCFVRDCCVCDCFVCSTFHSLKIRNLVLEATFL